MKLASIAPSAWSTDFPSSLPLWILTARDSSSSFSQLMLILLLSLGGKHCFFSLFSLSHWCTVSDTAMSPVGLFFLLTWTDSHCVSDAAVVKLQQFRIQRRVYSDFLNSCVQSDFQQRMGWVRVDRCCRALGWRGYGSHKVRWMNKWRASIRKHEALFKHSSQQRQCKLTTWNEQMHLSSIPE